MQQLARERRRGLKLKRLERRYVSVLLRQDSGVYKYESRLEGNAHRAKRDLLLPARRYDLRSTRATPGDFSYLVERRATARCMRASTTPWPGPPT